MAAAILGVVAVAFGLHLVAALVELAAGRSADAAGAAECEPTLASDFLAGSRTALASKEMRLATARILTDSSRAGSDPWADARAAELLLAAEAFDADDGAITRALRNIDDGQASSEIARRWFEAVIPVLNEPSLALRRSAAERALEMGEANDAYRWCESATSLAPDDPAIALMMGRVLVQLGELVAARVYLHKAQRAAATDELYARVAAELAELAELVEVSCHAADLEQGAAYANTAIAMAPSTRLAARNTLGKIHLGAGAWDVCDEHFADDPATAHAYGDRTAELRARLNRGIALLSKGLVEDARAVLEGVLEDGARYGQDRARAEALGGVGEISGDALRTQQLCLIAHADPTVAFGRRVLGARSSTGAAAYFAIVAARIAMARGSSTLARREIDRAISHGGGAGETEQALAEALLVSARGSLDDGDVNRARDAIEAAEARATSGRDLAELALLKALHLHATGRPAIDDANRALAAARCAGQEDLLSVRAGATASMLAVFARHGAPASPIHRSVRATRSMSATMAISFGGTDEAWFMRPNVYELAETIPVIRSAKGRW